MYHLENNGEICTTFRDNLDKLMYERKINNDSEIIKNINIEQSRFSVIRNAKALPRINELIELANYFGVTVDYFLKKDNETSIIDWKSWTYRDVTEFLFDMYLNGDISLKEGYTDIDYRSIPNGKYSFYFGDYISNIILEYENTIKSLPPTFTDNFYKIKDLLKKDLLEKTEKEKPQIFHNEKWITLFNDED